MSSLGRRAPAALLVAGLWMLGFVTFGEHGWFYGPSMLLLPVAAGVAVATGVLHRAPALLVLFAFITVDFVRGDQARVQDLPFFVVVFAMWLAITAGAAWVTRRVRRRRAVAGSAEVLSGQA